MSAAIHLDLDGAWTRANLPLPALDLTTWGPQIELVAVWGGVNF